MILALILLFTCLLLSKGYQDRIKNTLLIEGKKLIDVESLVNQWAPLVWLAENEKYFPSDVEEFLRHVNIKKSKKKQQTSKDSKNWFLTTKLDLDELLKNKSSILFGKNPEKNVEPIPVYADLKQCGQFGYFQVTYWLFFPYSLGKTVCTIKLGPLGPVPIPKLGNSCYGKFREFGSHVGDWEHISLQFKGKNYPDWLYMSVHDFGAYYKYDDDVKEFMFYKSDLNRTRGLEHPVFPLKVNLINNRPVIFAAKGSHGLWSAPGKHKYVTMPRLYDEADFGIKWETWEGLKILNGKEMWLKYEGRWGNERKNCHPFVRQAHSLCRITDGPIGIQGRQQHFHCL